MVNPPKKQSAYADYLYSKVEEILKRQGGAFTLKELSHYAGLKITPNMRRRINHIVASGLLEVHPVVQTYGGSCNMFCRIGWVEGKDILF